MVWKNRPLARIDVRVWPCRLFGSAFPCIIYASKFSGAPISSAENPDQTDPNLKLIAFLYEMEFWRTTGLKCDPKKGILNEDSQSVFNQLREFLHGNVYMVEAAGVELFMTLKTGELLISEGRKGLKCPQCRIDCTFTVRGRRIVRLRY